MAAAFSHAASPAVQRLVDSMPAGDIPTAGEAYVELLKMGSSGIGQVCDMIVPPGTGNDANARFLMSGVAFHVNRAGAEKERALVERVLLAALAKADDREVRAFFIRQLRWCGGDASAQALAPYLRTPELCEAAVFSLLSSRATGVEETVASALTSADAKVAATLLRAAGKLRSSKALPAVGKWAHSEDRDIRLVAQFALASIGDAGSRELLKSRITAGTWYERSQTVSHYLMLAHRLAESGKRDDAAGMCRELLALQSDALKSNVRCAALNVLAGTAGAAAAGELVAAFEDPAADVRATALRALSGIEGKAATEMIAGRLSRAKAAQTRRAIVEVLGARGDAAALPALTTALRDADAGVSTAAVQACAGLGGDAAVDALIGVLANADRALSAAIERALGKMTGDGLNARIAGRAAKAGAGTRVVLLRTLAARRAVDQVDVALAALKDGDADVRVGALDALRALGTEKDMSVLVAYLVKTEDAAERRAAVRAVVSVGQRVPDAGRRCAAAAGAWKTSGGAQRAVLLEVLPGLGGSGALELVTSVVADADLRDAAVRALSEWSEDAAVKPLLDIARTSKDLKHKVLALRGCIRIAREARMSDEGRLSILKRTIGVAERADEKRLAIAALAGVTLPEALDMATGYLDDEAIRAEAAVAVATLVTGELHVKVTREDVPRLKKAVRLLPKGDLRKKLARTIVGLPDPNDPNLALRRPVKTSCGHQGNHVPADAVDGDSGLTSGWWGVRHPCWLAVDLGKTTTIGKARVVFYNGDGRYYQYTIEVSSNGKRWEQVVDSSKTTEPCTAEGTEHRFKPVSTRHVRINILKNSANEAVHLLELQVFAPDG